MESAHVDPAAVDEGAVGFRLAPRINAAGRLGHPREALELLLTEDESEARRLAQGGAGGEPRGALELLLTEDESEARRLAQRLEEVNRERQAVEERILRSAVRQIEPLRE